MTDSSELPLHAPPSPAQLYAWIDRHRALWTWIARRALGASGIALLNDPNESEDIWQEIALAIWQAAEDYDPQRGTQFHTFAARRVRWALQNYRRRLSRILSRASPLDLENERRYKGNNIEVLERVEWRAVYRNIWRAWQQMPKAWRQVCALYFGFDGDPQSLRTVAQHTRRSLTQTRRDFYRALERLKQAAESAVLA